MKNRSVSIGLNILRFAGFYVCVLSAIIIGTNIRIFAQEPAPEEKPAVIDTYDAKTSPVQLTRPEVADRIGLTDAQRKMVSDLITEKIQLLGQHNNEREKWPEIHAEIDRKILSVLTPEQLKLWPKVLEARVMVPSINAPWEDALELLAGYLGKQLIMDAPPLGVFKFSDTKEYTATELLDLYNSILQTKGYTLIDYKNMLRLFDLRRPIPQEFIPIVSTENLDEYGKFSYITLKIPLERRDPSLVMQAIEPYKGQYSKITRTATRDLLVTDSASNAKIIESVAIGIYNPPLPPQEKRGQPAGPIPPAPPEPPVWETYIVEKNDPAMIEDVVQQFNGVKPLRVGGSRELHYYTGPSTHAAIRSIIDRLENGLEPDNIPIVETYSLEGLTDTSPERLWYLARMAAFRLPTDPSASFGTAVMDIIKQIAPSAKIAPSQVANKVVVFATPPDHLKIKDLFQKLQSGPNEENAPVIKVYKFNDPEKRIDDKVLEVIKGLVKSAVFTLDNESGQLLCLATGKEHELIANSIKELEVAIEPDAGKTLAIYAMTKGELDRFNRLYPQISREKELTGLIRMQDDRLNQLTIWASPKQQEILKKIISEIRGDDISGEPGVENVPGTKPQNQIAVYSLKRGNVFVLQTLLQNMIPGVELSIDSMSNSIVAYGPPSTIRIIANAVEEFESGLDRDVEFVPLEDTLDPGLLQTLQAMSPRANVVMDNKNMRLTIFGRKNEVDMIRKAAEAIVITSKQGTESIRFYETKMEMPDSVLDFLRKNFPRADIQYSKSDKRFTAITSDLDHIKIAKLVVEAEASLPPDEETRFYSLEKPVSDNLLDFVRDTLKSEGKNASRVEKQANNPNIILVRARPNVHAEFDSILAKAKDVLPAFELNELRSYPITPSVKSRFELVKGDLSKEIGDFRILQDDRKDIMTVWAMPNQHARIAALMDQISLDVPPERKEEILVHSLKVIDRETLEPLLKEIYPDVNITEDALNARIIVRMRPENLQGVRSLIELLDKRDPDAKRRYFKSYSLDGFYTYDQNGTYYSPTYFLRDISKLVPSAKVSYDYYSQQLILWGTEEEHAIIGESLGNLQKDDSAQYRTFPVRRAEPDSLIAMINRLFPRMKARYDYRSRMIIAEAHPQMLDRLEKLMDAVDPIEPGPGDPVVKFYKLESEPTEVLLDALKSLIPRATVTPDKDSKQLMVIGTPAEQAIAEKNIGTIVATYTAPEERMLFTYPVSDDLRAKFNAFLAGAKEELPDVKPLEITTPGELSIWAKPSEHKLIAEILEQFRKGSESDVELHAFPLASVDVQTAQDVIASLHPEAKLMPDTQGSRLLVWANKLNIEKVAETLKVIDRNVVDENQSRFESFLLDTVRFDATPVRMRTITSISENLKLIVPNAKVFPGTNYYRIVVWGTPNEIEIVRGALGIIAESPDNRVSTRVFRPRTSTATALEKLLSPQFPEATIVADEETAALVVFARNSDLKLIEDAVAGIEKESVANIQMLPYTISGAKTEIVHESIKKMYPGLNISEDVRNNRLFIWASPEEHAKINEMVEKINDGAESEGTEKFLAYAIPKVNYETAKAVLEAMFPDAAAYGDFMTGKITVKATSREHKEIGELFNQLQTTEDKLYPKFMVYPIGETDPVSIEILLQGLLQEAESKSPEEIRKEAGPQSMMYNQYNQYNQYGQFGGNMYGGRRQQQYNQYGNFGMGGMYGNSSGPMSYFRVDPKTRTAMVFAPEEDHKRIMDAINSLMGLSEFTGKPFARIYTCDEVPAATVIPLLQKDVPGTQIIESPRLNDFIAYGVETDHEKIKKFVDEINLAGGEGRRVFHVLSLPPGTKMSRDRLVRTLTLLYPEIVPPFAPGPDTDQIVFWGPKYMRDRVEKVITESCKPRPEGEERSPKTYTVYNIQEATATAWLQVIFPNAEFRPDGRPNPLAGTRLIAVANPLEHLEIEKVVAELDKDDPPEMQKVAKLYSLRYTNYWTILPTLRQNLTATQLINGDRTSDFIAFGPTFEQEKIEKIVNELNHTDPESQRVFHIVSLPPGSKQSRNRIIRSLMLLYPELGTFAAGPEQNQIGFWGPQHIKQQVQQVLDETCKPLPVDQETVYRVYDLHNITEATAIGWLQVICPNAEFEPAEKSGEARRILAYAMLPDHAVIAKTLAELDKDVPEEDRKIAKIYSVHHTRSAVVFPTLQQIVPNAQLLGAERPNDFIAFARPQDQARIESFVKEINESEEPGSKPMFHIITFPAGSKQNRSRIIRTLNYLYPELGNFAPGTEPNQIGFWSAKYYKERVQQVIDEICQPLPEDQQTVLRTYDLKNITDDTAIDWLQYVCPNATFEKDANSGPATGYRIAVYAMLPDHAMIAKALSELDKDFPEDMKRVAKIHSLHYASASGVIPTLQQIVPRTQLIPSDKPNDFLAFGPEVDQVRISEFVAELNESSDAGNRNSFHLVSLPDGSRQNRYRVMNMLSLLYPEVVPTFATGPEPNQIVFWGPNHLKDRVEKVIAETCKPLPEGERSISRRYTFKYITDATAVAWLRQICPNAIYQNDGRPNPVAGDSILIIASPIEHAEIEKAIAEIDQDVPADKKKLARIYTLNETPVYTIIPTLRTVVPQATLIQTASPNEFLANATAFEHEKILEFVEGVNLAGESPAKKVVSVLLIPDGSRNARKTIILTIATLFPDIVPSDGPELNQIVIYGPAFRKEAVQKLIDETCKPLPEDQQSIFVTYHVKNITAMRAVTWLIPMFPNTVFTMDGRDDAVAGQSFIANSTPLEHKQIEKAIAEIDKDTPDDIKPIPKFYGIEDAPPELFLPLLISLRQTFPLAYFVPNQDRMLVMAVANEETHGRIEGFIKNFIAERESRRPYFEVYFLTKVNVFKVTPLLQKLAPGATINPGTTPDQLLVYALKSEHADIRSAITKMETAAAKPPELDSEGRSFVASLRVYKITSKNAPMFASILQYQFPAAVISATGPEMIIAWASASEHEAIARTTEAIAEAYPEQYLKTYFTKNIPVGQAYSTLNAMFLGEAVITMRTDTGDLLIQATDDIHARIEKSLVNIDIPRPVESERTPVSYDLSEINPWFMSYVNQNIATAIPDAIIFPSSVSGQLIVYAKPIDQLKVKTVVDEIVRKTPDNTPGLEVYVLEKTTAIAAQQILALMCPNAKFGASYDPRQLPVWATAADHRKIKGAVEKMNSDPHGQALPKHYRFKRVAMTTVVQAIRSQVPGADLLPDTVGDLLLVTATPEEHERIALIVNDLDKYDPSTQTSLKTIPLGNVNPLSVYTAIVSFYRTDPKFQMYHDASNKAFIALANPMQHQFIEDLIEQIQDGGFVEKNLVLKVFELDPSNSYTSRQMVSRLMTDKGLSDNMQYDMYSNKLLVRARPQDLEEITGLLEALQTDEKLMDVFQLDTVDPDTAKMAINYLYSDEIYTAPVVDVDRYTNTIMIRGTQKQLDDVRNLLIRMGETKLLNDPGAPIGPEPRPEPKKSGNFRTINIQGNIEDVLRSIEKVWPELEENPLRIIREEPSDNPSRPLPETRTPNTNSGTQFNVSERIRTSSIGPKYLQDRETPHVLQVQHSETETQAPNLNPAQIPKPETVYITVDREKGTLSITSFDTAALDRLEQLIENATNRVVYQGRDFTIFTIRNVSVNLVYTRLNQILANRLRTSNLSTMRNPAYSPYGIGGAQSQVRQATLELIPDLQSNTLQVRGTKIERDEVEKLIDALDVPSISPISVIKPIKVPILNVQPQQVVQQVMSVYGQQIRNTQMPGGFFPRVTVDPLSRQVVIISPEPLATEMAEYTREIDTEAAENPGDAITVIPTEDINVTLIQNVLNAVRSSVQQNRNNNLQFQAPGTFGSGF